MKDLVPQYVDYTPDPKMTNGYIKALNAQVGVRSAQDLATEWASSMAAIAFMLRRTNSRERVVALMSTVAEDACAQFEAHERRVKELAAGDGNETKQ